MPVTIDNCGTTLDGSTHTICWTDTDSPIPAGRRYDLKINGVDTGPSQNHPTLCETYSGFPTDGSSVVVALQVFDGTAFVDEIECNFTAVDDTTPEPEPDPVPHDGCPGGDVEAGTSVTLIANHSLIGTVTCEHTVNGAVAPAQGQSITLANTTLGPVVVETECCGTSEEGLPPDQQRISYPDDEGTLPSLPAVGQWVPLPNSDLEFTRVSGPNDNPDAHLYSTRYSFSCNEKYYITQDFIYDLSSLDAPTGNGQVVQVGTQVPTTFDFVPSSVNDDLFYGVRNSDIRSWNVVTGAYPTIITVPGTDLHIGGNEGSVSWDDRYIVVDYLNTSNQRTVGVVDLTTGTLVGSKTVASMGANGNSYNWSQISPTGDYVVVGISGGPVYYFDTQMGNQQTLSTLGGGGMHVDTLYDIAGNEVVVQEGNYTNGQITYTILATNQQVQTNAVDLSTQPGGGNGYLSSASHVGSGPRKALPGYAFVSMQGDSTGMDNMFALKLEPGSTTVKSYGNSYSEGTAFSEEAKASIAPHGQYIAWTSDWLDTEGGYYEFIGRVSSVEACENFRCEWEVIETNVNQPPTATGGSKTTDQAAPILVSLSASDSDGTIAGYIIKTQPSNGSLSQNGSAVSTGAMIASSGLTYTPNAGFSGADSFTWCAVDDDGAQSDTVVCDIQVSAIEPVCDVSLLVLTKTGQANGVMTFTATNPAGNGAIIVDGVTVAGGTTSAELSGTSVGGKYCPTVECAT